MPLVRSAIVCSLLSLLASALAEHPLSAPAPQIPSELSRADARRLLLEHSLQLRVLEFDSGIAAADLEQARLRPNPRLSAESEGLGPSTTDDLSLFDRQELSIVLRYELETAGKRRKRMRTRELGVVLREREAEDLRRRLLLELDQSYYALAQAQADLEALEEIRDRFGRVVELNRARFTQGEISGLELRRTEAEQYKILEEQIALQVRLENAQSQLLALLGSSDLDQPIRASDPLRGAFDPPPLGQLEELASRHRPDLQGERDRLTQLHAFRELEQARSLPNVVPFAGYRRDFGLSGAIVGVEMELPVFARNQGNIAGSRLRVSQQESRIRLLELDILEQVHMALRRLEADQHRLLILREDHLPRVLQSRDILETSYRLGQASLLELLDGERRYAEAIRLYHQTLYDVRHSMARLEWAVGKDLGQ